MELIFFLSIFVKGILFFLIYVIEDVLLEKLEVSFIFKRLVINKLYLNEL